MISSRQQTKAQNKTNDQIAARYAAEEKRRRDGKEAEKSLAEQAEAKRQGRLEANRDDADKLRDFTSIAGSDDQDLRQGLQIGAKGADDA